MEFLIETQNLVKIYKNNHKKPAVKDISLQIPKGQLYGLVGPDGAGKTTTLRILSTVMKSSSGSAKILGYDLEKQTESIRTRIGYMPQNFSLYPDLSVMENLIFFANINQVPSSERNSRIKRMLEFTNLANFTDRKAGKLSGGMKKKLALACAMIHNPQVLLLDEPSTGVDPVSRRELWVILAEIVQQGVTVLVSTPYMDEAERCHTVGILYEGEMLTSGKPENLEKSLPFSILEVKAKPRKLMREIIQGTRGVEEWRPVGDRLRISINNHNGSLDRVRKSIESDFRKEKMDVRILRESKTSMEDVFVYQVNQKRETL